MIGIYHWYTMPLAHLVQSPKEECGTFLEDAVSTADIGKLWVNAFSLSTERITQIQGSVSEYDQLDRTISRLPQFEHNEDLLKCLSQFNLHDEMYEYLEEFGDQLAKDNSDVKYEIIVENQRGATLFGSKLYTQQQLLYPVDPPKFQTLKGKKIQSLSLFPEPNTNWKWVWNKWHVLMINDVDEEGWIYSDLRFNSHHWTSAGQFGKFARRRLWIRMMKKIDDLDLNEDTDESLESLTVLEPAEEFSNPKGWFFQRNYKGKDEKGKKGKWFEIGELQKIAKLEQKRRSKVPDTESLFTSSPEGNISVSATTSLNTDSNAFQKIKTGNTDNGSIKVIEKMKIQHKRIAALHNQHIRNMYFEVSSCPNDSKKTGTIIEFFRTFKNEVILFLIEDYELCENKSNSWIFRIIKKIHLKISRKKFLKKFQEDIIAPLDSREEGIPLRQLYDICDYGISNDKI